MELVWFPIDLSPFHHEQGVPSTVTWTFGQLSELEARNFSLFVIRCEKPSPSEWKTEFGCRIECIQVCMGTMLNDQSKVSGTIYCSSGVVDLLFKPSDGVKDGLLSRP